MCCCNGLNICYLKPNLSLRDALFNNVQLKENQWENYMCLHQPCLKQQPFKNRQLVSFERLPIWGRDEIKSPSLYHYPCVIVTLKIRQQSKKGVSQPFQITQPSIKGGFEPLSPPCRRDQKHPFSKEPITVSHNSDRKTLSSLNISIYEL